MASSTLGVRLTGTERDIALLHALVDAAPWLLAAPWSVHPLEGGSVLTTPQLDDEALRTHLQQRGIELSEVPAGPAHGAAHLAQALRPVAIPGDPDCEHAWLLVDARTRVARDTLERLLRLGRDDVKVAIVQTGDRRLLLIEVSQPPAYLLMRAREEPQEGVVAYARQQGRAFVEWGWRHPLPVVVDRLAERQQATLLVSRDGDWISLDPELSLCSIYDVLTPELHAPRHALQPAPGQHRFELQVRLGSGQQRPPEAWLVDPEAFLRVETLLGVVSPEARAGLLVSRLESPKTGVRYLLRERRRAGQQRLGRLVSDTLGVGGFAPVPGLESLLLPTGRQLLPALRRDDLRQMLELDRLALALVIEGEDGPWVAQIPELHEQPLTSWVDLIALDHRVELDRLRELALFSFTAPPIEQRPPEARPRPAVRPPAPPRRSQQRPAPRPRAPEAQEDQPAEAQDRAALQQRARPLEEAIAAGGVTDAALWAELGGLQAALGADADAGLCLEAAAFHGAAEPEALAKLRHRASDAEQREQDLIVLVLQEPPTQQQIALLGARLLQQLRTGPLPDGLLQPVVQLFSDPLLPAGRRLAWAVLRACHDASDDRLGLTRAREAVLGGLNAHGLHHSHDVPRFVRLALAFGGEQHPRHEASSHHHTLDVLHTSLMRHGGVVGPFRDVIVGTGFLRLGDPVRSRELIDRANAEPPDTAVGEILVQLYTTHASATPSDDPGTWAEQIATACAPLLRPEHRAIQWFCKRSGWLGQRQAPPPQRIRQEAEALAARGEAEPRRAPEILRDTVERWGLYDHEIAVVVARLAAAVRATGSPEQMTALVAEAHSGVRTLHSNKHRARVLASAIETAAAADDHQAVVALLDEIAEVAAHSTSVYDLLAAVRPALLALRRLGLPEAGRDFLLAIEPLSHGERKGTIGLIASLAEGFLQLRELERAEALMTRAIERTVDRALDHVERDRGAAVVFEALRHWPVVERTAHSRRLTQHLDRFHDTFTVGQFFPTFKLLFLERLVDTIVDTETLGTDRVRAYLDAEELSIRRQIHADWNARCGR